jgi:hypothetical protein
MLKSEAAGTSIHADLLEEHEALNAFRFGKYSLVVVPDSNGGFEYRYDPARPESVLARVQVDDAIQSAAGRKNAVPVTARVSNEPGAVTSTS